jgi:hypothetical protein
MAGTLDFFVEPQQQQAQAQAEGTAKPAPGDKAVATPSKPNDGETLSQRVWDMIEAAEWRLFRTKDTVSSKIVIPLFNDDSRTLFYKGVRNRADQDAEREFPEFKDADFRFLARKDNIHKSYLGPALSQSESKALADRRLVEATKLTERFAANTITAPEDGKYRALFVRSELISRGFPATQLTPDEKEMLFQKTEAYRREREAETISSSTFPNPEDKRYREMMKRQFLGEPLSVNDDADLYSKKVFPDKSDDYYRNLFKQTTLYKAGMGAALTPALKADLDSKLEFRYDKDPANQALAKPGSGPHLSPEQFSDWMAKREFPNDLTYRTLARKSKLSEYGGQGLDQDESNQLCVKRGNCKMEDGSISDNFNQLTLAADSVGRHELGSLEKFQTLIERVPEERVKQLHQMIANSGVPVEIRYADGHIYDSFGGEHLVIVDGRFRSQARRQELLSSPDMVQERDALSQVIRTAGSFGSDNDERRLKNLLERVCRAQGDAGSEALAGVLNEKLAGSGYSVNVGYYQRPRNPEAVSDAAPSADRGDRPTELWLSRSGSDRVLGRVFIR